MILEEVFGMQEIWESRLNLAIGEMLFLEVRERLKFGVGIKLPHQLPFIIWIAATYLEQLTEGVM